MNYTKHQIKRIRDLNEKYFEVVIGKRTLNFVPGSTVKLYNDGDYPLFIASGIQEPWVRLILNRDLFAPKFPTGTNSVRLSLEVDNVLPTLHTEKSPNFVLDAAGIGAFFSYVSTFPNVKCKVCYLGQDKVQEDWVKANHKILTPKQMGKLDNIYVVGNRDVINKKAHKIINNCKSSYLYE